MTRSFPARVRRAILGRAPSARSAATRESFALPARESAGRVVTVINDCSDQKNYGAAALVDGLRWIVSDAVPDATLVSVPSHWLIDRSSAPGAFVDGVANVEAPMARFPEVADQFDSVADEWLAGGGGQSGPFLERLAAADLVILNGEGSIYRTNQSAVRELFLAWLAKERLGRPTLFVNGTVHLTDVVPILPAMARKAFAVLDAVAVREAASLRNLRQFTPGVAVHLFPDSAFAFGPEVARPTAAVASLRRQIGDAPFFCFDPGPMPVDDAALRELIDRLRSVAPTAVLVSSAPADDFIRHVADATGAIYVGDLADYRQWMALVADAQFLVSGRYHNPILAAIMGCPSITFASTSHKVHGACEMLDGLIGTPFDGTDLRACSERIVEQAAAFVAARSDVGRRLQAVCAARRAEVDGLRDLLRSAAPSDRVTT